MNQATPSYWSATSVKILIDVTRISPNFGAFPCKKKTRELFVLLIIQLRLLLSPQQATKATLLD